MGTGHTTCGSDRYSRFRKGQVACDLTVQKVFHVFATCAPWTWRKPWLAVMCFFSLPSTWRKPWLVGHQESWPCFGWRCSAFSTAAHCRDAEYNFLLSLTRKK